jgi:TIR domain
VSNFNIQNSNIEQFNNQGDNVKIVERNTKDATEVSVKQSEYAQPIDRAVCEAVPPSQIETESSSITSQSYQPSAPQLAGELRHTSAPIRLFYSYSHKDGALRDKLEESFALLKRQGLITDWHDRKISAGDEWKGAIDKNLEEAQIILLLVSASFIASDYCWDIELKRAIERHERGEARVIPIILRPCVWNTSPIGGLQALPKDAKPVIKWRPRDDGFKDVAEGIRRVIEELTANPRRARSLKALGLRAQQKS